MSELFTTWLILYIVSVLLLKFVEESSHLNVLFKLSKGGHRRNRQGDIEWGASEILRLHIGRLSAAETGFAVEEPRTRK